MERLRDDVAWEHLDDGGVLFCQLAEGAYWQLGPPSGQILQLLVSLSGVALIAAVADTLGLEQSEAAAALAAFRETLVVLNLLEPATGAAVDPSRGVPSVEPRRDG